MQQLAVASVVGIQPNLFNSLVFSFLYINLLFLLFTL